MSTADARLWEMIEGAALAVTDESTGRFEKKEFVAELRDRLGDEDVMEHIRAVTLDKLAESLARGFGERRSPKPGRRAGMFHPQGILKLGDGKWIWMEYATDRDLIEWGRLSTRNLARVAIAEGGRQRYVAERLEAFEDHRGWKLGRIEREVFGFIETEDFLGDTEPDWDEEA